MWLGIWLPPPQQHQSEQQRQDEEEQRIQNNLDQWWQRETSHTETQFNHPFYKFACQKARFKSALDCIRQVISTPGKDSNILI